MGKTPSTPHPASGKKSATPSASLTGKGKGGAEAGKKKPNLFDDASDDDDDEEDEEGDDEEMSDEEGMDSDDIDDEVGVWVVGDN